MREVLFVPKAEDLAFAVSSRPIFFGFALHCSAPRSVGRRRWFSECSAVRVVMSTPVRRIGSGCCARHERPRDGRPAEQRDELALLHSITSSARASTVVGISSPSVFAVLRLITNSYLVGACTGTTRVRARDSREWTAP
jgi:hypothetical protein